MTETQSFDVEKLIPLMQQYIYDTSPHIRRLLISWIDVMDNVPGIDILDFLPGFLEGLFDMLSDPHREIRQVRTSFPLDSQETDSLLQTLLAEIKESTAGEVDTSTMVGAHRPSSVDHHHHRAEPQQGQVHPPDGSLVDPRVRAGERGVEPALQPALRRAAALPAGRGGGGAAGLGQRLQGPDGQRGRAPRG